MKEKSKVTICGGGQIGEMVALFLSDCGDYECLVLDKDKKQFSKFKKMRNVATKVCDITKQKDLEKAAKGTDFIISTAPFSLTTIIASAAKNLNAHYIDLTEDIAASEVVKKLAKGAKTSFIPQSGLAPGFISILAYDVAKDFDELHKVRMRVGALAKYPHNAIKYNLTWSTEGLVNEYCEPCNAVKDGKRIQLQPMEGYEHFTLDGVNYEAFNTSGGVGTLPETWAGKIQDLTYKSIRYPGHLDAMRFLINDLKLKDNQKALVDILNNAIPSTQQDVVLVYAGVSGIKNGAFLQETRAIKIYAGEFAGRDCTAIQLTTAGAACAVIDLVRTGKIKKKGFVKQENINFDDFINNRFGRVYAPGEMTAVSV
jgi:saccharopine dehydrogenase-like NADP-dependent oxidoreductase